MTWPVVDQEIEASQSDAPIDTVSVRKVPRGARWLMVSAALITASAVAAQSMGGGMSPAASTETEEGIPVTDALTKEKCGVCHTADAKGNLSRISWIRTTPEGWDQAIKRMVRLNGAQVSPDEARHIIHYLGSAHDPRTDSLGMIVSSIRRFSARYATGLASSGASPCAEPR